MTEKPVLLFERASESRFVKRVDPCLRPFPHAAHRHKLTVGDLVGGYWCDGQGKP